MRPIPALAARRAYRGWAVVIAGSLTLLACGGPAEADRMRAYWRAALLVLKARLEGGDGDA